MFKVGDKVRVTEDYLDRVHVGYFEDRGFEKDRVYSVVRVKNTKHLKLEGVEGYITYTSVKKVEKVELEVGMRIRVSWEREGSKATVEGEVTRTYDSDGVAIAGQGTIHGLAGKTVEVLGHALPERDRAIEFWGSEDPDARYVGICRQFELIGFQIDGYGSQDSFGIREVSDGTVKWRYLS